MVQVADLTTVALTEPTILPTELPVTKIETENLTEVKKYFFANKKIKDNLKS